MRLSAIRRGLVFTLLMCCRLAGPAIAQPAQPLSATSPLGSLAGQVPLGSSIEVTDAAGTTISGRLAAISDDLVRLHVRAGQRVVPADQVRRVRWQRPDSVLNGVLIGASIGAIPGLYWLAVDPNECAGMCPEEYALIAAGALAGGLIDRALKRKVTVYISGAPGRGPRAGGFPPYSLHARRVVHVAVRF
jgi:hypothetical protein